MDIGCEDAYGLESRHGYRLARYTQWSLEFWGHGSTAKILGAERTPERDTPSVMRNDEFDVFGSAKAIAWDLRLGKRYIRHH